MYLASLGMNFRDPRSVSWSSVRIRRMLGLGAGGEDFLFHLEEAGGVEECGTLFLLLTAEMVDRYSRESGSSIVMAATLDIIATDVARLTATRLDLEYYKFIREGG